MMNSSRQDDIEVSGLTKVINNKRASDICKIIMGNAEEIQKNWKPKNNQEKAWHWQTSAVCIKRCN